MPRNVRNFWVELFVDGRPTPVAGGPRNKDGGFSLKVLMRDRGAIVTPLYVRGQVLSSGALRLSVDDEKGRTLYKVESER